MKILFLNVWILAQITVVPAKDDIYGTPDLDGDGDGDPIYSGGEFKLGPALAPLGDPDGEEVFNTLRLLSSHQTEFWAGNQHTPWEDYALPDTTTDYVNAHLVEELSLGDQYVFSFEAEYALGGFTTRVREVNGYFPSGTTVSFGISNVGEPTGLTDEQIQETSNMTERSVLVPDSYLSFQDQYDWFSYTIDSQGEGLIWKLVTEEEHSVSEIIYAFILPETLAEGEFLVEPSQWALSGYDKDGEFGSVVPGDEYYLTTDGELGLSAIDDPTVGAVFGWTMDNKNDTWGEFNVSFVPEPSFSLMFSCALVACLVRRAR